MVLPTMLKSMLLDDLLEREVLLATAPARRRIGDAVMAMVEGERRRVFNVLHSEVRKLLLHESDGGARRAFGDVLEALKALEGAEEDARGGAAR